MNLLRNMRTFCRVAETGSFSETARGLNISAPLVSRHVSDLEAHLGIRLLNRTTRHVELSEAGAGYYRGCVEVLEQLDALESQTSRLGTQPSGLLRVSLPMDFGRLFLGQAILEFLSQAPKVRLEVIFEDRVANLLQEQVDVAIRIGSLDDSSLVSRKLGQACISCYASADYLAQYGAPLDPDDLAEHRLLSYSLARAPGQWLFGDAERPINITRRWRLAANNGRALAEAACRGLGIVRLPEFLVQDHVEAGQLVEVLKEFRSSEMDISATYVHRKFRPAKVTVFVDFLVAYFNRQADWLPRPV